MPVWLLVQVQQVNPLFFRQTDLLLSLTIRTINKTGLNVFITQL